MLPLFTSGSIFLHFLRLREYYLFLLPLSGHYLTLLFTQNSRLCLLKHASMNDCSANAYIKIVFLKNDTNTSCLSMSNLLYLYIHIIKLKNYNLKQLDSQHVQIIFPTLIVNNFS